MEHPCLRRATAGPGCNCPADAVIAFIMTGIVLLGGCSHLPFGDGSEARPGTVVRAGEEATVDEEGAALHLPAGSLDRDATVRVTRAKDSPSGLPGVDGFDFDIGEAQLLKPAVITLPVTGTPATRPGNRMLVPYQSAGRWGTEIGVFDPARKVVSVEVRHLSWYTGAVDWLYGLLRKNLGDRDIRLPLGRRRAQAVVRARRGRHRLGLGAGGSPASTRTATAFSRPSTVFVAWTVR